MRLFSLVTNILLLFQLFQAQTPVEISPQTGRGAITGRVSTKSGQPVVGEEVKLIPLNAQGKRQTNIEAASLRTHLNEAWS